MSAGLPGLGLGGLFFILSALLAPFIEAGRIAIGRRRDVDWSEVWRQFALAVAMIAAVDLTLRAIYAVAHLFGVGDPPSIAVATVIPLIPVAITGCLLAAVLLIAKAADLAMPVLRELPPISFPSRARVLAGTGAVAAVWFALLFVGASDLSSLSESVGKSTDDDAAKPLIAEASRTGSEGAAAGEGGDAERGTAIEARTGPAASDAGPEPDTEVEPAAAPAENSNPAVGGSAGTAPAAADPVGSDGAPGPSEEAGPPAAGPPAPGEDAGSGPPGDGGPPGDAGPPEEAGPPDGAGPPEEAGPPEHSNAPPHAGPG